MKSYKKLSLALLTLAAFSYANSTQTNEVPKEYPKKTESSKKKTSTKQKEHKEHKMKKKEDKKKK